jgi:hypothetical protein
MSIVVYSPVLFVALSASSRARVCVCVQFLTVSRSIDCDRREFFAYAEAFAALVKLEFVSIK